MATEKKIKAGRNSCKTSLLARGFNKRDKDIQVKAAPTLLGKIWKNVWNILDEYQNRIFAGVEKKTR